MEQLKQEIANANRQKQAIRKALENKVSFFNIFLSFISFLAVFSAKYIFPMLCILNFFTCFQEKSLDDIRTQIEQLRSSMAMKEAEMGTELVDHLTPEEREQLSRLNPEIKDLKEKLIAYKTDRIEVRK